MWLNFYRVCPQPVPWFRCFAAEGGRYGKDKLVSMLTQILEPIKQAAQQVDVSQLRNSLLAVCVSELRTALGQERGVTDRVSEFARVLALLEAADGDNSATRVSLEVVRELAATIAQFHDPNGTIARVYSHLDSRGHAMRLNVPAPPDRADAARERDREVPDLPSVFHDLTREAHVTVRAPERTRSRVLSRT